VSATSTPTNTPVANCQLATAPLLNPAEQSDPQAILYATTSPNATVTTTFVTGSPAYPNQALFFNGVTLTTLNGTLVGGNYQYTFNDGPFGVATLVFIEPANAALGTVTVNSSANEACGTTSSTTSYRVVKDEAEPKASSAGDDFVSGVMTLSFVLPSGVTIPAHIATSTHGAVRMVTSHKNGKTVRNLIFRLPRSSVHLKR
jgi:hypothetical protein